MYDKNDPRAALKNKSNGSKASHSEFAAAKYVRMYETSPVESNSGTKTWWSRGQNFFVAYSEAADGETFTRKDQVDEYVVLLLDKSSQAIVTWNDQKVDVEGFSLIVIPKGDSEVKVTKGGRIVRLITALNNDLAELPINKDAYNVADPNVAPFEAWAESPQGSQVRVYSLDVPAEEGRFGRIFRCSTFMVNYCDPHDGPREKLSPHSHDDFEQCSLIIEGEYMHHLRWPWTPNKAQWRPDEHEHCGSPSVTIMPAGVIHTSESIGSGRNQLIDIFCPPRLDFSKQPGWVLNDEDYPLD